jgi:uncharacterized surface protein with fasciclin (FAS1) repeats
MKKRMLGIVALVAAMALTVVAFAPAAPGNRPTAPSPNIVDTAIAVNSSGTYAGQFDVLLCLVTQYPDIVSTLSQRGQYTVFAPVDAAFAELGITTANCAANNGSAAVKNILLYHVTVGARDAADVTSSTRIRMLNGQFAAVDGATIDGQNIIVTDVRATNGIIHAVDGVLLP